MKSQYVPGTGLLSHMHFLKPIESLYHLSAQGTIISNLQMRTLRIKDDK